MLLEANGMQAVQELVGRDGSSIAVLLAAAASHLQHHQQLLDADRFGVKSGRELQIKKRQLSILIACSSVVFTNRLDDARGHVFSIVAQHRLDLHRPLQLTHMNGHVERLGQLKTNMSVD